MVYSERSINQRMILSRDGGRENSIGITLKYSFPPDVTSLRVQLPPSIDVTESDGFQLHGSKLTWDKRTTSPSMTGRYDPSLFSMGGVQAIDRGEWAVVTQPAGGPGINWSYSGPEISYKPSYEIDGTGVISSDGAIAYLGAYEQYTRKTHSEWLKLILPNASTLAHEPKEILDCIEAASGTLEIGPYNDEVLMIAAPSSKSNWGPTGTQFGEEGFWALDQTILSHPNNTWIHEYIHTRQNFDWDESLLWFIEGTATYLAAWVGVNQKLIDFDWFYSYLTGTTDPNATLSDPDTWASYQTKYTKGTVVTTALAAEILRLSDRQLNLMDIVREMSAIKSDEQLSVRSLQSYFEKQNIPELSAWLDRYVNSTEIPHPPNDSDAYAFDTTIEKDNTIDSVVKADDKETELDTDPEPTKDDETGGADSEDKKPQDDDYEEVQDNPEVTDIPLNDCPVCGVSVDNDDKFCDNCGTEIQRECFVCGGQAPGQEFCPICGTKLIITCTVCGHKQKSHITYCEKCGTEL